MNSILNPTKYSTITRCIPSPRTFNKVDKIQIANEGEYAQTNKKFAALYTFVRIGIRHIFRILRSMDLEGGDMA